MRKVIRDYEQFWCKDLDVVTPIHTRLAPLLTGPLIIDIGSGTGRLANIRRDLKWLCLDGAIAALSRARTRADLCCQADVLRLPLRSDSVEELTCIDVVEHLPDPRPLLEEVRRVLLPGGVAWVATPNVQYLKHILGLLAGRAPVTSDATTLFRGGHLQDFTSRDFEQLASEHGFILSTALPVYANRFGQSLYRFPFPLWINRYAATGFIYRIQTVRRQPLDEDQ